jgi:signal transduction histidine kinase
MDQNILMAESHSTSYDQNTPADHPEIAAEVVHAALDRVVFESLKPTSAGLCALYAVLTLSHLLVLPQTVMPVMASTAATTALILFWLRLLLERRQIPVHLAHPIGAFIAGLVLFNSLLHLHLLADLRQTTYLLLLIVGVGSLMLSTRWFISFIAITLTAWGLVTQLSLSSADLIHFGFAFFSAIILASIIHVARVRALQRLEILHLQEKQQHEKLQFLYQSELSRRRMAETLYRMGRALTQILDLTEVLDLLLEDLSKIVSYDRAAVMLQSDDLLEVVAARGFPADVQPLQLRVPIQNDDDDVFKRIYYTQQPLAIPDVLSWPTWQHLENLPAARAWLGVPLIRQDKVIGMLSLTREIPNAYGDEEVALATTFAGQAAIALENARLYHQLAHFSEALEDEVEERTSDLQVAYIELERLDKTKSDFISIASHELRTPLTVLRGYSKMLLKDPKVRENPEHLELVAGIHSGAMRLGEIVSSLIDMAKIDSDTLEFYPETLSVDLLVQLVCQEFAPSLTHRNQRLKIENLVDLPLIEADPDLLRKVFHHLLSNAIKYTPDGGKITIAGRFLPHGREGLTEPAIEIIVSDTGIGIARHLQRLIFNKFYQTQELHLHSTGKTKFKGSGSGLGLAITRGIVEAHQGKIWLESPGHDEERLPGSHFHVVLPVKQKFEPKTD